ncbi:MAG: SpoIIE family protein phosphatase [Thermovirgaceae bacterium]
MPRRKSLAGKVLLWGFLGSGLVLTLVVASGFLAARLLLEEELEAKAMEQARATACSMAVVTEAVERTAETASAVIGRGDFTRRELVEFLKTLLRNNSEILGSALALEQGLSGAPDAPYVYRDNGEFPVVNLAAEKYRFETREWFTLPKSSGLAQWSEPYYDEGGGNVLMATYSAPLEDARGSFLGVLTADLSLQWLTEMVGSISRPGKGGYAFMVSAEGKFISHPEKDFIMNESVFSIAGAEGNGELADIGRRMIAGEEGFAPVTLGGVAGWLGFSGVGDTGWSLGVFFPRAALLRQVADLSRIQALTAFAGLFSLLLFLWVLARTITKPLRALDGAVQAMGSGDATVPLPEVSGEDEVVRLTSSFATMRYQIQEYMAELSRTAAARERIESELRIGRSIQMSLVPKTFPPFPDHEEFSIYAMLEPAREVGGDFYDFFLTDDGRLWTVVGDVSGKGVPAALFMAVTRTFIRALSREESSPAQLLKRLNNELAEGNEESMFVTLFVGVLDPEAGVLRYVLGGHPPPLLAGRNGSVSVLPEVNGALVGAMEGILFEEGSVTLAPGDLLVIYTDGVTEAMNADGDLFGDERTKKAVTDLGRLDCQDVLEGIRKRIKSHAGETEQSDDITLLALCYSGGATGTSRAGQPAES